MKNSLYLKGITKNAKINPEQSRVTTSYLPTSHSFHDLMALMLRTYSWHTKLNCALLVKQREEPNTTCYYHHYLQLDESAPFFLPSAWRESRTLPRVSAEFVIAGNPSQKQKKSARVSTVSLSYRFQFFISSP